MSPRYAVAVLMLALAPTLSAQGAPLKVKEEKAGMLKQAAVLPAAALATAKAQVPGGTLKAAEIEREDGKLLYVFSFTKPGVKGEEEVLVDATTGALSRVEHETPEDEAREQAADAAKAKAAAKAPAAKPAAPAKPIKPPAV